jgi:hypothetical protein
LQGRSNPNYYARTGANGKRIRAPICSWVCQNRTGVCDPNRTAFPPTQGSAVVWRAGPGGGACGLLGAVSLMCYGRKAWTQATLHMSREMGKRIKDKFTDLPISRQWRYQLRMKRKNRCVICGELAVRSWKCLKHMVKARERQRKKMGHKRRLRNALSYRLQRAA